MKKYITIATLLAAGSAFANADDVWNMDFSTSGVVLECASGVTTNLGSGVAASLISEGVVTLNPDRFSFSQTSGNLSYADEFCMEVTVKINKGDENQVLFSFGETNAYAWCPTYDAASKQIVLNKIGFNWKEGLVNEDNKASGNVSYTIGEDEFVTVSVKNDGQGVLSMYVDGVLAGSSIINEPSERSENKLIKLFTIGGNKDVKSYVSVSDARLYLIPEPSTFGLLAGLGALALVGTRRRRK